MAAAGTADEYPRASGAQGHADRIGAPRFPQTVDRSGTTAEMLCLIVIGGHQPATGNGRTATGMWIPHHWRLSGHRHQCVAQRPQLRQPAAVVGDAHSTRRGEHIGDRLGQWTGNR